MRIITNEPQPTPTPRQIAHDAIAGLLLATVPVIAMLCFGVDEKEIRHYSRPAITERRAGSYEVREHRHADRERTQLAR